MGNRIVDIFKSLGGALPQGNALPVTSPGDGAVIATLATDDKKSLEEKMARAILAQKKFPALNRAARQLLLENLSAAIKQRREMLAELITLEGGKTIKEALGEADGSADIIVKTIKDATLAEFGGMIRVKERPPVGVVGLITSFNFPLAVANWTIAPALLAGNGVIWKPSEKTPLVALAYKIIFDKAMGEYADLLQVIIGERDLGEALVAHEQVDMISATGSVAMGKGIKATLTNKKNNSVKPILELGGNNGVIISDNMSPEHAVWAVQALLNSFLGTTGQRCTNTRRLIVHRTMLDMVVALLAQHIRQFTADDYGYGALIDKDAFVRFEKAKAQAREQGGEIISGLRLLAKEYPEAYYIEPALAIMPSQTNIMHEETFAPLLFIAPYDDFEEAITMVNAPANAGLVNAIYTQSQREAELFAAQNLAGHSLINSPKGTGTPAFGMGFGGNKDSGEGEILNAADPLRAFTREIYHRMALNKDIIMSS